MSIIASKKVSNYELFYDLVFVLAISMITGMVHHTTITLDIFFQFILTVILIIRLWINETLYLNKYGKRDLFDVITIMLSTFCIGYMSTAITLDWQSTYVLFNSLFILNNCITIFQYYWRGRENKQLTCDMHAHMKAIIVEMMVVFVGISLIVFQMLPINSLSSTIIYSISLAVPFLFKQHYDVRLLNLPHLIERCQLITIIAFGETVLAVVKHYPLATHLFVAPALFLSVCCLFMAYITQTAPFLNHHQQRTGTVLLYTHIGILIGVTSITVGIEFIQDAHTQHDGLIMLCTGLLFYYVSLLPINRYHKENFALSPMIIAIQIGIVCMSMTPLYLLPFQLPVVVGIVLLTTFAESTLYYVRGHYLKIN